MELNQLQCLLIAAEALSFRRAAEQLGTVPSVVSRTIAVLEDDLGVELFERSSKGVRLTQVGHAFLQDARGIVAAVDRARETAGSVASGYGGRLRVGVCEDATTPIFAAILAAHREQCPAVELELFELPSTAQPAALRRRDIDVGLLLPPVRSDSLQLDELWTENWLVAMPSDHRLADSELIAVSDLTGENFVTAHSEFGPGSHQQTQEMFVAAGVRPCIIARAFRRMTVLMLVHSGAGVTLVPGSFASGAMDGIVTRPLEAGEHRMRIAAAYPAGDLQGIVARFLRIATTIATQLTADRQLPISGANLARDRSVA